MQREPEGLFAPSALGRRSGGGRESGAWPCHLQIVFSLPSRSGVALLYLRLMGEFDMAAVGRVENALDRVFEAPATSRVVFDLRRLTFIDSEGLRTILRANERARAERVELVVVRPRGTAGRIFTLTRAGEQLDMVDEPEVS